MPVLFSTFQRELVSVLSICKNDRNDDNYHVDAHVKLAKSNALKYMNATIKFKKPEQFPNVFLNAKPCGPNCRIGKFIINNSFVNPVVIISLSSLPILCKKYSDVILCALNFFHCFCNLCVECFLAATRSLTQFSKKCNTLLCNFWSLFCHGENLAGFNLTWTKGDKDDAIRDWCSGEVPTPSPDYASALLSCMLKVFPGSRDGNNLTCKTLADYVQNSDEWLTAGSGSVPRSNVLLESGEVVRARKNKTLWAMHQKGVQYVVDWLMSIDEPMVMHCADKVELGRKERLIIVAGEDCLILFGFIHYYISHIVRSEATPLFFSSSHLPKFWFNLMILCRNKHVVAFPYDAPNFDQNVSRLEWRVFFGWMYVVINRWGGDAKRELLQVLAKCNSLFFKLKIRLPVSGKIITWDKGVPSGIRFTALADTVINIARQQYVYELLTKQFGSFFFCKMFGLGDDILLFLPNMDIATAWFNKVNELGYGANASKNWTSYDCGEFLKRVIYRNSTRGYLLRRLGGHAFRDPTKAPLPPGRERMEERLASFLVLNDRYCNSFDVFNELCYSLTTVTFEKIKLHKAAQLARTPRFAGGCGLTSWSEDMWLGWVSTGEYTPPRLAKLAGLFSDVDRRFAAVSGVDAEVPARTAVAQRIVASTFAPSRLVYQRSFHIHGDTVDPLLALFHCRDAPTWSSCYPFPAYLTRYWFKSKLSQGDFDICLRISSTKSRPIVEIMLRSWRKRDICLWVDGQLDLGSAAILDCGTETCSFLASYFRRKHFERLLAYHRVDSKHIDHSKQVVERSVHKSLRRMPNRLFLGK